MLCGVGTITNTTDGRYQYTVRLVDVVHTFKLTKQTIPKRDVKMGDWRPTKHKFKSVRGAVQSIRRYTRRASVHVLSIQHALFEGGIMVERREIA
jgi:hypothetical protein